LTRNARDKFNAGDLETDHNSPVLQPVTMGMTAQAAKRTIVA
jgi:hypothetical protein